MPSTTATDILEENVPYFEATLSVDDAIDAIRTPDSEGASASDSERTVYYAYVVDEDDRLEGVVSLRELLNADQGATISEIATDEVVSVDAEDPADRVAKVFASEKFMALPVVDDSERFLGAVRAGDVIEALDEDASKAVLRETIRDVEYDPADESAYECFTCGTIVTAAKNPGECPNCGGDVRHRQTAIE